MTKPKTTEHKKSLFQSYKAWILVGLGLFFMILAQTSFWITNTIYDQQTFTKITSESLLSDSSREAIASSIVTNILADRPLLRNTISGKATSLVSGLLATDFSQQALGLVVEKSYTYLTSSSQEPIAIDLTAIKSPLSGILWLSEQTGREPQIDINRIPDTIAIFEPKELPNLHGYGIAMLWLGPIFTLISIALFAVYLFKPMQGYARRVYTLGLAIIGASIIGLLMGPVVPPSIAALLDNASTRIVASNLAGALLKPFVNQMTATILLVSVTLLIFSQRQRLVELLAGFGVKRSQTGTTPKKTSKKRE